MTARVYQYGLLDPTEGAEIVDEQIRLAHRYRNLLTEIERDRRARVREILAAHPDIEPLEEEVARLADDVKAARNEIKAARKASRSRSETAPMRARVKELRDALRERRTALKAAKAALRDDAATQAAIAEANDMANRSQKEARAQCGVYWGTYLLAEDAAKRARRERMDPKFHRFTGDGAVSVQIQGGTDAADIFRYDTRVRIDPVSEIAWLPETPRGRRRRLCRTVLHLRVGSDGRAPVWASFPMIMHRPLPDGARIKRVTVHRRRRDCRRWRWSVDILCEMPDRWTAGRCGTGAVAVNLGWRQRPEGRMRVAYWRGDDGEHGEILLDPGVPSGMAKADDLRSVRDQRLDLLRPVLSEWLRDHRDDLPEWLSERTSHVHAWRAAAKFAALAKTWRGRRFDGDAEIYALLEAWRYKDEHLQRWESGARSKALRRRREQYRCLAADLSTRYGELIIDKTDYRQLQRSPAPESERVEYEAVKLAQRRSSPSELRRLLIDAFGRRGGSVIREPAENLTRSCNACGSMQSWDAAMYLHHACTECGARWDQDDNACRNLLARERSGGDETPGTARANDGAGIDEDGGERAA